MKIARDRQERSGFLDGQMLIAMPSMRDERFARPVIYMCAHSAAGAMGLVVNQPAREISFPDLLVKLEVIPAAERIQLPARAGSVQVLKGGPVETQRGFVLHSADSYIENSTLPIAHDIRLPAALGILKAIARGEGPASALLALGYAGWAPGQLEHEFQLNGWLHCLADLGLVFGARTHPPQAESVGERDDRAQDQRPPAAIARAHQRLVDLEHVEGEALQIGERGMAGAEVVEREAGAKLAPGLEHLGGGVGGLPAHRFGGVA